MAMLVVVGVIAVFVALGLYGNWLEKHPEHTPAGREAAMRQRHEDEMIQQAHAHELAMARALHEPQMAVFRARIAADGTFPVLWRSEDRGVNERDAWMSAHASEDNGPVPWWYQSAGLGSKFR